MAEVSSPGRRSRPRAAARPKRETIEQKLCILANIVRWNLDNFKTGDWLRDARKRASLLIPVTGPSRAAPEVSGEAFRRPRKTPASVPRTGRSFPVHESICHPIFRSARAALAAAAMLSLQSASPASPVVRTYDEGAERASPPVIRNLAPASRPPAGGHSPRAHSVFPAVEAPAQDWDVGFLRVNLFVGRHRDVYGLDVGAIGNETTGDFVGVQAAGLYNRVGWSEGAFQFAGILNRSTGDFAGLQAAFAANVADGTMTGFQCGLVNRAARLDGLQIGFFNIAETGSGVQIGFWNSAQSLEGLQIGFGNVNADSSMPFFPVVNFAF